MSDTKQEYTTQRGNLLLRKRELIGNLTDLQSVDGAVANSKHLAAIERIYQELRYIDAKNSHKGAVFESLPNILKAEPLLPIRSRRDINLANTLKQHQGWRGEVILIDGGPDEWQVVAKSTWVHWCHPTPLKKKVCAKKCQYI